MPACSRAPGTAQPASSPWRRPVNQPIAPGQHRPLAAVRRRRTWLTTASSAAAAFQYARAVRQLSLGVTGVAATSLIGLVERVQLPIIFVLNRFY
jgi:hypothetical protein